MAFQMWRKRPDGQQRKKILHCSKKSISGKNFLQKAWRQQKYFGYRDGNSTWWEPQLFQIKELQSSDSLYVWTVFKGKSQLLLSVLCPLQLLKQSEDSHFCLKQWADEMSSGLVKIVNRRSLWELSPGKKTAALRLLPRIRWSLPSSLQMMAACYLLYEEVPVARNCSAPSL